jgi:hypothetical protein
MTKLSKDAIDRHRIIKAIQNGGGPKAQGAPPGPAGQQGGGTNFPRYGPTIQAITAPPGPLLASLST